MNLSDILISSLISASIWAIIFAVKKGTVWKYIAGAIFSTYLFCVASVTILPIHLNSTMREVFSESGWRITDCIVLIPFHDGISTDDLLNVIMTIPFGFLFPFVKKKATWRTALIAGAVLGVVIELLQLALAAIQGFSLRYVDVSDVICNTAGTMIGWLIAAAFIFTKENDLQDPIGFPVVIKELLSHKDFESLKVGDTISDVAGIDPVAEVYRKKIIEIWNLQPKGAASQAAKGYPCTSIHYLKDGILKIEYEMTEERELIIKNIVFSEDYKLTDVRGNTIDYRIVDGDLPK